MYSEIQDEQNGGILRFAQDFVSGWYQWSVLKRIQNSEYRIQNIRHSGLQTANRGALYIAASFVGNWLCS
jgi:hypothetical protein